MTYLWDRVICHKSCYHKTTKWSYMQNLSRLTLGDNLLRISHKYFLSHFEMLFSKRKCNEKFRHKYFLFVRPQIYFCKFRIFAFRENADGQRKLSFCAWNQSIGKHIPHTYTHRCRHITTTQSIIEFYPQIVAKGTILLTGKQSANDIYLLVAPYLEDSMRNVGMVV